MSWEAAQHRAPGRSWWWAQVRSCRCPASASEVQTGRPSGQWILFSRPVTAYVGGQMHWRGLAGGQAGEAQYPDGGVDLHGGVLASSGKYRARADTVDGLHRRVAGVSGRPGGGHLGVQVDLEAERVNQPPQRGDPSGVDVGRTQMRESSCCPPTPNRSAIGTVTPHLARTACTPAFNPERTATSLARWRPSSRNSRVAGAAGTRCPAGCTGRGTSDRSTS